jgi:hypothetical protein
MAQYASGVPGAVGNAGKQLVIPSGPASEDAKKELADAEAEAAAAEAELARESSEATSAALKAADEVLKLAASIDQANQNINNIKLYREAESNFSVGNGWFGRNSGGIIPKSFSKGGFAMGSDIVPARLTPGEFVMSKYAVQKHGIDKMKSINNGDSFGDSVYNYSISVNVKSDANPDEIARVVMTQIKGVDSQKLRGNRF